MVNIRPLNPELQEKAKIELFEVPERIEADLTAFKEWINKSAHLKGRTDDQFLIAFLRGTKFSLERAKEKYDLFFTLKQHIPELCRNRDPKDPKVLRSIRQGVGVFLPGKNPDEPTYLLIRPGSYDPSEFTIEDIMKIATMGYEIQMIENDNFIVAGNVALMDFTGMSLAHIVQYNPTFLKKFTMYLQDALPIRQKASHFVKMPQIALAIFNIFSSLLNEKNRSRLYVHGNDIDEISKIVPKYLLPTEYGGDAGPIQILIEESEKRFMKYRDYFIEDEQYGVDEKKRIGKSKNPESLFGTDGSFRKLAID